MFVVYIHYDNFGGVALEGGLNRWAVSVADLAISLLDLGTFGASAASYFHWKRVWQHWAGFFCWIILKI